MASNLISGVTVPKMPKVSNIFKRDMADYYPNCAAAEEDGIKSILRFEKAYRPELDGDNDGIACEPYYGVDNDRIRHNYYRRRH